MGVVAEASHEHRLPILTSAVKIFQGAESIVYLGEWLGRPAIFKQRFPKRYRHPKLDAELTKQRTRSEVRNLIKARSCGIDCPAVLSVRLGVGVICMEYVPGETVAEFLCRRNLDLKAKGACSTETAEKYARLPEALGKILAKFHDELKIVHGDLTTSNVIVREMPNSCWDLCLLDFGLATVGNNLEDRAVDLYVLERAIQSCHADCAEDMISRMLTEYGKQSKMSKATLSRLESVRQRGRKRVAFG